MKRELLLFLVKINTFCLVDVVIVVVLHVTMVRLNFVVSTMLVAFIILLIQLVSQVLITVEICHQRMESATTFELLPNFLILFTLHSFELFYRLVADVSSIEFILLILDIFPRFAIMAVSIVVKFQYTIYIIKLVFLRFKLF